MAHEYVIIINCSIGEPGHGREIVDGLNAVDFVSINDNGQSVIY